MRFTSVTGVETRRSGAPTPMRIVSASSVFNDASRRRERMKPIAPAVMAVRAANSDELEQKPAHRPVDDFGIDVADHDPVGRTHVREGRQVFDAVAIDVTEQAFAILRGALEARPHRASRSASILCAGENVSGAVDHGGAILRGDVAQQDAAHAARIDAEREHMRDFVGSAPEHRHGDRVGSALRRRIDVQVGHGRLLRFDGGAQQSRVDSGPIAAETRARVDDRAALAVTQDQRQADLPGDFLGAVEEVLVVVPLDERRARQGPQDGDQRQCVRVEQVGDLAHGRDAARLQLALFGIRIAPQHGADAEQDRDRHGDAEQPQMAGDRPGPIRVKHHGDVWDHSFDETQWKLLRAVTPQKATRQPATACSEVIA